MKNIKVHIECGETYVDFVGDVNQVFESVVRFLIDIYPALESVQRILYNPNLVNLLRKIDGYVTISKDGPILVSGIDLPARHAICIVLLGSYIGFKLGIISNQSLSSSDLAKITVKARKTVSNEIPRLISEGIVERTSKGEYGLTTLGISRTETVLKSYLKE